MTNANDTNTTLHIVTFAHPDGASTRVTASGANEREAVEAAVGIQRRYLQLGKTLFDGGVAPRPGDAERLDECMLIVGDASPFMPREVDLSELPAAARPATVDEAVPYLMRRLNHAWSSDHADGKWRLDVGLLNLAWNATGADASVALSAVLNFGAWLRSVGRHESDPMSMKQWSASPMGKRRAKLFVQNGVRVRLTNRLGRLCRFAGTGRHASHDLAVRWMTKGTNADIELGTYRCIHCGDWHLASRHLMRLAGLPSAADCGPTGGIAHHGQR